ncbi:hypothetical protein Q9L58_003394 [Maublancomyces gigas]|uniref:Uncharacterized protein n=1 Tax=Discina gigas TaxID=1032678 RepID=A0ABR3GP13_9PEZI
MMAATPATEPMASEGSNFEVVIEKRLPSNDFEVIPEELEEDEITPDHYYEDCGIPVFKPVSSAARSFCCIVLILGRGFSEVSRIAGRKNGSKEEKPCNGFEC